MDNKPSSNPLNRLKPGGRNKPSAVKKVLGVLLLTLSILLISTGAIIGFVQGVKKPAQTDNTAVVTTTTVAQTTTTTAATATTEMQTPPTVAL